MLGEARAEDTGRHADQLPKRVGEVALVCEAGFKRDLGERCPGTDEPVTGELNAPLTDVVSYRASQASVKFTGEVNVMNTRRLGEALERMMRTKLVVDVLLHPLEPRWRHASRLKRRATSEFGEQRDNNARHRRGR